MLKELNIKNFAIIDQLRVEFAPGLNVFTGETGAGKSIVVDALNLALGERASADLIRTGCQEAVVEAAFELNGSGTAGGNGLLAEQGIEMDSDEDLIVRRVLSASGKNKVYINGSLANLATLATLGANLADIHGQHEHQSLLVARPPDGDARFLRRARRPPGAHWPRPMTGSRTSGRNLPELEAGERDRAQREDMLRFQKNEIDAAMLKPGEDEELANEQKLLANSEKLARAFARSGRGALFVRPLGPDGPQEGHDAIFGRSRPSTTVLRRRSSSARREGRSSRKRRTRSRPMPTAWNSTPTGWNRSATGST